MKVQEFIKKNPLLAVGGAVVIGMVAYNIIQRRRKENEEMSNAAGAGMCITEACSKYPVGAVCRECSRCTSDRAKDGVWEEKGGGIYTCTWTPKGANAPVEDTYDRNGNFLARKKPSTATIATPTSRRPVRTVSATRTFSRR